MRNAATARDRQLLDIRSETRAVLCVCANA